MHLPTSYEGQLTRPFYASLLTSAQLNPSGTFAKQTRVCVMHVSFAHRGRKNATFDFFVAPYVQQPSFFSIVPGLKSVGGDIVLQKDVRPKLERSSRETKSKETPKCERAPNILVYGLIQIVHATRALSNRGPVAGLRTRAQKPLASLYLN